jgi:hypothetical protein
MADLVDKAILDDKQYLAALKNIDKNIQTMTDRGQRGFNNIEKDAKTSGVQIGIISGIVSSVTTEFINLGRQAISTLENIAKQGIETALSFDTLRSRLLGIFDGSEQAADAAFKFIRDRSEALGIDLSELAGAFLPKTESLQQFERVAKIATALARSDPEQGAIGARIALIEALSGTFTSLQRRFEFTKAETDRLKEAFDTKGIEGFLDAIEQIQKEGGKSFEVFADTAQGAIGQVEQFGTTLLGDLGGPVLDSLKAQFEDLGTVIDERGDDFELVAGAVGDLVANIVDFIGTNLVEFLQNLDTDQVIRIVNDFNHLTEVARQFVDILSIAELPQKLLNDTEKLITDLDKALTTAIQISAIAKAESARIEAEKQAVQAQLPSGVNTLLGTAAGVSGTALAGGIPGVSGALTEQITNAQAQLAKGLLSTEQQAVISAAGQEAYNKTLQEAISVMDESARRETDLAQKQADRAATQGQSTKAGEDAANSLLAQAQAARNAADALDKYNEAQEKVTEEQAKFETELEQRGNDILVDRARKEFDILNDIAEKRAELARKNADKLADIQRDQAHELEDESRKDDRKALEIDQEQADKRVDVEEQYQRNLRDIRERYSFDLNEAGRRRDAVEFLRLVRQRQQDVQDAQQTRNDDLQDAKTNAERKRDELRQQQEYEREDANINFQRKLEDQRIADEREIEELQFQEQNKLAELDVWQERQYEDLALWAQRKQEQLNQSLSDELAVITAYEQQKTQIVADENAKRLQIIQDTIDAIANAQETLGVGALGEGFSGVPSFANGGVIPGPKGKPRLVIAHGGEIVKNPLMIGPTGRGGGNTYNTDNSRSATLNGMDVMGLLDTIVNAKLQNTLGRILG